MQFMVRRANALFLTLLSSHVVHAQAAPTKAACIAAHEAGQTERKDGHFGKAVETFVLCGNDACPAAIRKECTHWNEEVKSIQPSVVLSIRNERGEDVPNAQVLLDGAALADSAIAITLDPGKHTVKADAPGYQSVEQGFVTREAEQRRTLAIVLMRSSSGASTVGTGILGTSATPRSPAAEEPRRAFPMGSTILGVLGLGLIGGGAGVGLRGTSLEEQFRTTCAPTCKQENKETLQMHYAVADALFAVGAVLSVVSVVWLVTHYTGSAPTHARTLDLRF
jgi:hypothetical protein